MRYQREQLWWLGACVAGLGLTALAGDIIGPEVALFVLVALAGWLLIRYEGPPAVSGPLLPLELADNEPISYPEDARPDQAIDAEADTEETTAADAAPDTDESATGEVPADDAAEEGDERAERETAASS